MGDVVVLLILACVIILVALWILASVLAFIRDLLVSVFEFIRDLLLEHGKGILVSVIILGGIVGAIFCYDCWEKSVEEKKRAEFLKRKVQQEKIERERQLEAEQARNAAEEEKRKEEEKRRIGKIYAFVDAYFDEVRKVDEFFVEHTELADLKNLKQEIQNLCSGQYLQCRRLRDALNGRNVDCRLDSRYLDLRKRLNYLAFLLEQAEARMQSCYLDSLYGVPLHEIVESSHTAYAELSALMESTADPDEKFSTREQQLLQSESLNCLFDSEAVFSRALASSNREDILKCCVKLLWQPEVLERLSRDFEKGKNPELLRLISDRVLQTQGRKFH